MSPRNNANQNANQNAVVSILLGAVVVALIVVGAYFFLNRPDTRTPGEKIGDAVQELGDGTKDAARQLQDRTPAEKIGDAVDDAREDIRENTN